MTIVSEFYKDAHVGPPGETYTLPNGWRYQWVVFGSVLENEISSLRASAYDGTPGNVYAFADHGWLGNYVSLNMQAGYISWWDYVGDSINDDIETALIVERDPANETVLSLGPLIAPQFASQFDAQAAGTEVSRVGDPKIYTTYWPGYDPSEIFVSIEQDLHIDVPDWFDYSAQVRYDVKLYRTDAGGIDGYVAWVYTWVEGGIISGTIFDRLEPRMVAGAATLTSALRAQLAAFGGLNLADLYLLPSTPPTSAAGDRGNAKDGSSLVLAF